MLKFLKSLKEKQIKVYGGKNNEVVALLRVK